MKKRILLLALCMLSACSRTNKNITTSIMSINSNTLYTFNEEDFFADYDKAIPLENAAQPTVINQGGTYLLSGNYSHGIIINAAQTETIRLVLENACWQDISEQAIQALSAKKVLISLPKGTTSKISSDDPDTNYLIYSKIPLVFNGEGSLDIHADYRNAIQADDELIFASGNYSIASAGKAISSNTLIAVYDANFQIKSRGGAAMQLENESDQGLIYIQNGNFCLESQSDGITSDGDLVINDGVFNIATTDDGTKASRKGIQAGGSLQFNDGTYYLSTSDDAIHCRENCSLKNGTYTINAAGNGIHADENLTIDDITLIINQSQDGLNAKVITINRGRLGIVASDNGMNAAASVAGKECEIIINGGKTMISASGDGLDSKGQITINGGEIYVYSDSMKDAALNYKSKMMINGGTMIVCGYSQMAMLPSEKSAQPSVVYNLEGEFYQKAIFTDEDGKAIISWQPGGNYNHVIVSSPKIMPGNIYTLTIGSDNYEITPDGIVTSISQGIEE